MIRIGVSACFLYPDESRPVHGPKTLMYLEQDMAKYLSGNERYVELIPYINDKHALHSYVDMCDAIVFQGGTDLAPESYNEKPIGAWKGDAYRDAYELHLFDIAFNLNKPILCICRGMQLMNVYFGGTLYQDLKTQFPDAIVHRNAKAYDTHSHRITLLKNTILHDAYGMDTAVVNSVHHQAVKRLGRGLDIEAFSLPDQVIEAVTYTANHRFILGVQWHPEFAYTLSEEHMDQSVLLNRFLEEIKH